MDLRKSIRRQTDFALTITKHLFSKQEYQEKNMIFSPFSLHVVLSIMAAGSAGSTLDELLSFLRFDSIGHLNTFFSQLVSGLLSDVVDSSHRLSFINGMWAHKSFSLSHSFKQLVATHYKATLASVDFGTKGDQVHHDVNLWVEKETKGVITELLPPRIVDKFTKLIFVNALYFKGAWKHKFDASKTDYSDFYLLNGTSVEVPFMISKEKEEPFKFISTFYGFKVLRLSYRQGRDKKRRFSMYIFLPDAKDGLSALIEKLASESGFLEGKFPRRKVRTRFFGIPKFEISFELQASHVLKELGVVSPFSQGDANFTKMVDVNSDELYVDSIFHKAFIKVNEEGTTAAAATAMLGRPKCSSSVPAGIDFVADHPFLFLIREDLTGTILFLGQVLHPLGGEAITLKEDLRTKYLVRPLGNAEEEEESSDFESDKNEEKEDEADDDYDDKPEVALKRKKSSIVRAETDLQKSIRCQTNVALSITKHLFSKEDRQEKNTVFSPLSLHVALSVMAAGSEGRTLDELLSFLQFESVDHLNAFFSNLLPAVFSDAALSHHLSFANGMWADNAFSLSSSFKQFVATHYKATLASADFIMIEDDPVHDDLVPEVNSWIEKETNGFITELLPPRTKEGDFEGLIFANALPFKGAWKHKFDDRTFIDYFHLLNGTSVKVPFMRSKKKTQYIRAFDGFKVLRLSYKQGKDNECRFSMCIFLPNANDGLPALIEKLASKSGFLKGKLPRQEVGVRKFMIPKFKISFTFEASNVLKELGVVSPFSKGHTDFSKMVRVNTPDTLYVESIFHKAFVEVNEEDVEATTPAVVLGEIKGCTRAVLTDMDFVADHPFLFLIREDLTGTILFIGQVVHPLDGESSPLKEGLGKTKRFRGNVPRQVEDEGDDGDVDKLEVPTKRKIPSKRW
ncbi:hypothetical protein OROGR_000322 [Orobanche gracilis]